MKNFLINLLNKYPQFVLSIRYLKWKHKLINWKNPTDLQEYVFCKYIEKYKNKNLQVLADLTDKINVRNYVKNKIGEQYLTKLYGEWSNPNDIPFEKLPDKFVIKTNNGCGTNIIIRNKEKDLNIALAISSLNKWLKFPYGTLTGQPHYSLIKPKILVESYLEQIKDYKILPYDYKFFCFNGKPKFILFYEDRKINGHIAKNQLFDIHWNPMMDKLNNPSEKLIPKPKSLDKMIEIAKKLSEGFEFVRVDLYEINDNPIFGEITFTPDVLTYFKPDFININNINKYL